VRVRKISSDIGEVRIQEYSEIMGHEAKAVFRTLTALDLPCVLVDHRVPHSMSFQAQLALRQQRTAQALALWVDRRPLSVSVAEHLATIVRPTCAVRLFYGRDEAAAWLRDACARKRPKLQSVA